jgi:dihydrofolate reductase
MNYNREKALLFKRMGEDVVKILKETNAILAGGAITSLFTGRKISDWDLYFRTKEDLEKCEKFFQSKGTRVFVTARSATYSIKNQKTPYQIITYLEKLSGEPNDIFAKFDFTICMGAYDFKGDAFVFAPEFWKHLAQRRLVFNIGTLYPIVSVMRAHKYARRGFLISGVDVMKMALAVDHLHIKTFAELKDQLMGIDTAFLQELTDRFATEDFAQKAYEMNLFMDILDQFINEQYEKQGGFEDEGEDD